MSLNIFYLLVNNYNTYTNYSYLYNVYCVLFDFINWSNLFLICMINVYIFTIILLYLTYRENNSISSIISDKKCNTLLFFLFCLMSIFTILYEVQRNNLYSLCFISILLVNLCGIICVDETITAHYVCAGLIFVTIICFMYYWALQKNLTSLFFSLICQLIVSSWLLYSLIIVNKNRNRENILCSEIFLLCNFAGFYLYLH